MLYYCYIIVSVYFVVLYYTVSACFVWSGLFNEETLGDRRYYTRLACDIVGYTITPHAVPSVLETMCVTLYIFSSRIVFAENPTGRWLQNLHQNVCQKSTSHEGGCSGGGSNWRPSATRVSVNHIVLLLSDEYNNNNHKNNTPCCLQTRPGTHDN